MIYRARVDVDVIINVQNQDVFERVIGLKGDEWRKQMYNLHTREDVLEHFAYNAVTNGIISVQQLDGWADANWDDALFEVVPFNCETEEMDDCD